ncbi:uncharacterized protein CMC5_007130 [Chondromyces crocatus]|uniref:Uncharacterized protein n=1 Tax=Chondromyces crocatus TaxID=52 RepID=A0A0K1E6W0_CHOCO|nr:uncharacterized protein CMC5_007130 [Chondromyces crocatus]
MLSVARKAPGEVPSGEGVESGWLREAVVRSARGSREALRGR